MRSGSSSCSCWWVSSLTSVRYSRNHINLQLFVLFTYKSWNRRTTTSHHQPDGLLLRSTGRSTTAPFCIPACSVQADRLQLDSVLSLNELRVQHEAETFDLISDCWVCRTQTITESCRINLMIRATDSLYTFTFCLNQNIFMVLIMKMFSLMQKITRNIQIFTTQFLLIKDLCVELFCGYSCFSSRHSLQIHIFILLIFIFIFMFICIFIVVMSLIGRSSDDVTTS